MSGNKLQPKKNIEIKHKVKDSKFFGSIFVVSSRKDAEKRIEEIKRKYNDASHNVSAYRVEENSDKKELIEYFDDDGEPAGSSGPPVLEVIKGENLINTLIVVTRYFGGTKLGIGGLIRAYGDTARLAVNEAGIRELAEFYHISAEVNFDYIGAVLAKLEAVDADIKKTEYNNSGALIKAVISAAYLDNLRREIKKKTADNFKLNINRKFYI